MGPHPAVAQVRRAVRTALAELDLRTGSTAAVIVALSGGADSTALAAAAAFEAVRSGRAIAAVTVDHGLQSGSTAQAERAAITAYELGLSPVHTVMARVGTVGGPEGAARAARYDAIDAVRCGAPVLLGHTRDDQAETVLLGLGRGSGPRSIAGMRPYEDARLRPLLELDRSTTVAACAALDLPVWDDPQNREDRFRRVRLRHEVLPLMEDVLGGGVAAALARTARLTRDDLDALDELAGPVATAVIGVDGTVGARDLASHPRAIRARVLRSWARDAGVGPLTATHLAELDGLLVDWHGQNGVDLPGGFSATRRSGRLHVRPRVF